MEKTKIVSIFFESEEVAIRIVSDPKNADIVVKNNGSVTTKKGKSLVDTKVFKEEKALGEGADNKKTVGNTQETNSTITANQLEVNISQLLINLGVLPHIKGYRYTIEAIKILIENPKAINGITKDLYPKVAEIFNTTSSKVERAIRHGIEISFVRGNEELRNELFVVASGKTKPTNSEFLSGISEKFRLKNQTIIK